MNLRVAVTGKAKGQEPRSRSGSGVLKGAGVGGGRRETE